MIRVAPTLAGTGTAADATGFGEIEVLRGSPVDLYVRLQAEAPNSDLAAAVEYRRWTFVGAANDRPGGTAVGGGGTPDVPLRMQWNGFSPVFAGHVIPYELHLRASVRVTNSDGTTRDFDLNGFVYVTVRYQAAAG